jgi:biopolymer transport protein ExbB
MMIRLPLIIVKTVCFYLLVNITLMPSVSGASDSFVELLNQVKQSQQMAKTIHQRREATFLTKKNTQAQLLDDAKQALGNAKRDNTRLHTAFDVNQADIAQLKEQLSQQAQQTRAIGVSLKTISEELLLGVQASYSGYNQGYQALLKQLSTASTVNIQQVNDLWVLLQQEMIASTQIHTRDEMVSLRNGVQASSPVIRIGSIGALSQGQSLYLDKQLASLTALPQRIVQSIQFDSNTLNAIQLVPLDLSGGQLIPHLLAEPTLLQKIQQGGVIGYVIIGVAVFGLLVTLERFIALSWVERKTRQQLASVESNVNNPLGRVITAVDRHKVNTPDAIEAVVDEAVLKEIPSLEKRLSLLKMIYGIAPLLGLLGTVTGMIETFQVMTFFGNSDPALMAKGISHALMTTALGLIVAIPFVWFHSYLMAKKGFVIQVLESQSAGIIAKQYV